MKAGEKVVCVKGFVMSAAKECSHVPIVGNVYVVDSVHGCYPPDFGLHLLGITVPFGCARYGGAAAWRATHFRKLDELKSEAASRLNTQPEVPA